MEKDITFGSVTLDQLLDAQHTIAGVLDFISKNKDSDDEKKRDLTKMALLAVMMNDMLTHPIISSFVREEAEKIKKELNGKDATDSTQTFSFSIRPTSDKS